MKRKVFEKDTDDQFIIICNPFRQGSETQDGGKWRSRDANIIAERLRRALGSTGTAVSSIFVVSKVWLTHRKGIIHLSTHSECR